MQTKQIVFFKRLRTVVALGLLILGNTVFAQNLKDDIVNNDLEGLKAKVALLEPNFKDYPYIAYYLKNTKEYQQAMLDYLIVKGASVDQVDEMGVGPLYYAIATDNLEAVTTLINAKANVNVAWTQPKSTYWNYDFGIGVDDVYELPLFDPAKVDFVHGGEGKSTLRPLAAALYSNNTDIVPALLKAGADPLGSLYEIKDPKSSSSSNPVYSYRNTVFDHIVGRFATSGGSLKQVSPTFFANAVAVWKVVMSLPASKRPAIAPKLTSNLFAYFANGAMKDFKAELVKTGDNTLDFLPYAALAGNWEIVDLILKYNNMEIDDCFNGGRQNLLEWAILNLHAGAAQLLLEHGAAMPTVIVVYDGYENKIESYPLVWAARNNKPELVKVLLTFKADPNTGLPLFYTHNAPVVRKLLLEAGANTTALFPYFAGYSGWNEKYLYGTLLSDAAYKNSTEAVKFWLEKGLDPNPAGSLQPLVAAVARGNPESVKQLLEKGANPGILLDEDTLKFFDFPYDFKNKPLIELARYVASNTSDPLKKSRANQIVKLLEKALAAGTP